VIVSKKLAATPFLSTEKNRFSTTRSSGEPRSAHSRYKNPIRTAIKPKILIIDDDTSLRWVLEYNLQETGYLVITAASGEEGLRLFGADHPALVGTL
jgi:PleD family two-component response regulator